MPSPSAITRIGTESQTSPSSVPKLEITGSARSPKSQRIPALDFTKGTLVLIMVLYHWLNYFSGMAWTYYRYLRFLTPSFIFITGFMISHVYLSRYAAADPRLSKRLLSRGLKLIAIFLVLNLSRIFVIPLLGTGALVQNPLDLGNIFAVFVSGNLPAAAGKLVSFSILVPISYLLMLSGALMLAYRLYRYTFHVVCLLLLLSILILGLTYGRSYNLEFITIGMLGVVAGFTPIEGVNDFVRHPYALAFAYLCYTIAITIWDTPFLLLTVGVFLSVTVIYLVGATGAKSGPIKSEVILLGKYSLLGYISQVAILQILSAGFRGVNPGFTRLAGSFLAAFVLTVASVELADWARARMTTVDRLYKAVFA